jgi:hypothetical protein
MGHAGFPDHGETQDGAATWQRPSTTWLSRRAGSGRRPPSRSRTSTRWNGGSRRAKLAAIYEKSKLTLWNPADLPWDGLRAEDFTVEQRLGIMYWFAVLANFDASGPAVFARATIHAFEQHEEDPVRKCFFSITRDEMNHEECCQRTIARCGRAARWTGRRRPPLESAAHNNIAWLYHNGGRYWTGYNKAVGKYSLPVLFTSFMMGEMAASTLFRGMSSGTTHPVFSQMFQRIGRDESRHLQICMTILENEWPGLTDEVKGLITRQLRAGFVFLSMILWEPPEGFWELPPYFLPNHRVLMSHARDGGLGVLSYEEQARTGGWRWRGCGRS